ncbi:SpoIIIAH-like family protein [Bacillus sp. 03113]|uniref:SpoIIIAH-like family protein n=1 Tax=Bacillus sp. 03113 TaxID=2578211 RepID=UPI001143FEAB|nr:SpoIIIAH-like family protein [Bacillus sp. 03113]
MLLKKQTVWLLTMLSLVVVLSVYYITSPEPKSNDLKAVEQKAADESQTVGKQETMTKKNTDGSTVTVKQAGDDAFEVLRMQIQDDRSKMKEDLETKIGSTDLSAVEKSKAKDEINQLNQLSHEEEVLETLIKAMKFDDVLVRADGDKVLVTVKSKEVISKAEANNIIQTVRTELGASQLVTVETIPIK